MIRKTNEPVMDKILQDLQKQIDELKKSVNSPMQKDGTMFRGKDGDIRFLKGADKKGYLEVMTRDGVYTTVTDVFQLQSRERIPASFLTTNVYVAKLSFTSVNVPSTLTIGVVPAGYTLSRIVTHTDTAFGSDNRITIGVGGGATIVPSSRIDNREISVWNPYTGNTLITAALAGTPSTGAGWILMEALKETE